MPGAGCTRTFSCQIGWLSFDFSAEPGGRPRDRIFSASAAHPNVMASSRKPKPADVQSAAVPAEKLTQTFPRLHLPLQPPYPPAEAKSINSLPHESGWLYEPKWDGFRCLAFRLAMKSFSSPKRVSRLAATFLRLLPLFLPCPRRNSCWMAKSLSAADQAWILMRFCSASIQLPAESSGSPRDPCDVHGVRSSIDSEGQIAYCNTALCAAHGSPGICRGQHQYGRRA